MMLPMPKPQQQFYGPGQGQLAQAMPQPVMDTAQAPGATNPILEALKARQMADAMKGSSQNINATDPWTAVGKALSGGLEGFTQSRALEAEEISEGDISAIEVLRFAKQQQRAA